MPLLRPEIEHNADRDEKRDDLLECDRLHTMLLSLSDLDSVQVRRLLVAAAEDAALTVVMVEFGADDGVDASLPPIQFGSTEHPQRRRDEVNPQRRPQLGH